MTTPRRYQFDNTRLPTPIPPTTQAPVYRPEPLPPAYPGEQGPVVVQHIHQAPPDRTVQRVALGSGVGAGAVAAGVYFGPLLVAALTTVTISLAVIALIVVSIAWAVHHVVRSVGGPDGEAAAKTLTRSRRRRG
ncbi:DUF6251 family protein [Streptomyces sp. NPDC059740]|uniref:DUF6251 family protein n=1 Tax=Streptomyces sp. NPDC059740 TaxID=3346926 RepID=UPI0036510A64